MNHQPNSLGQTHNFGSLNMSKIKNMLKLQELFHNKYLTVELLHQLISLYTCSIESTDQDQSELKYYFLEKIQFVLSRPENQVLLEKAIGNVVVDNLRETFRSTSKIDSPKIDMKKQHKKLIRYDGENPDDKKKKIDLQMKVMEETQQNINEIKKQVQQATDKNNQSKQKISEITKNQHQNLQERLANRRKAKLRKKSFEAKDSEEFGKVIQKSDLLKAQEQIRDAVIRMTIRLTQKQFIKKQSMGASSKGQLTSPMTKGRVKTFKNFDEDY